MIWLLVDLNTLANFGWPRSRNLAPCRRQLSSRLALHPESDRRQNRLQRPAIFSLALRAAARSIFYFAAPLHEVFFRQGRAPGEKEHRGAPDSRQLPWQATRGWMHWHATSLH